MSDDENYDDIPNWWDEEDDDLGIKDSLLAEQIEREYNVACEKAYRIIEEDGVTGWLTRPEVKNRSHSYKVKVFTNLITHFEKHELYERCAFLKQCLDWITEPAG